MYSKAFVILVIAICSCLTEAVETKYEPLIPSESYTHFEYIDNDDKDQYKLFWKQIGNDEIQFEVHCRTTGWVGLGISPNGGMAGSDITIGWVANGKAELKDTYATAKSAPKLDAEQNVFLIDGAEVNGYTILKFKRKLLTCDKDNDKEITDGSVFMIFAWNPTDPTCTSWTYHGANRRTRSLVLLGYKNGDIPLPDSTRTVEMKMRNVEIKAKSTYYYCDLYELPTFSAKMHLLQFEMLIEKQNQHIVHHMLAYECNDGFDGTNYIGGKECGNAGLPVAVSQNCQTKLFVAWGIGAQNNYSFPKEAGYPFAPAKSKFILIEMHYDNAKVESGRFDNSGVRFYFSQTLRPYDLGLLMFGVDGNTNSIQIPAQTDELVLTNICYPQCLQKFIPDEGIYAVSSLLHTHLAGTSVRTSLVRNGKIIKYLFDSPNYDFNYQYLLDIEPTKIMKGDALINECKFKTTDRSSFTNFGFGTYDEMCYSFIYYYPQIPKFVQCFSPFTAVSLSNFYKSLWRDGLLPGVVINENDNPTVVNRIVFLALRTPGIVQSTPELVQRFKNFFGNAYDRNVLCGSTDYYADIISLSNLPEYTPANEVPVKSCDPAKYELPTC